MVGGECICYPLGGGGEGRGVGRGEAEEGILKVKKKLHEGIRGGGRSIEPLPSTFDTIHPID